MMLVVLILVVVVSMTAPGLALLRKAPWHPLEILCTAIGLSGFLLYLSAFLGSETGFLAVSAAATTLLCLGALLVGAPRVRLILAHGQTRRILAGMVLVLAWSLLLQSVVRHYGGANWSGDWFEHYQRSMFFTSYPKDLDVRFIDRYLLPARPPVMNLVVAHFLVTTGTEFAGFQIVHTILGSFVFLPLCLLMRRCGSSRGASVWILAALLSLSPMYCQNVTYTWTRLFCAFYVLLGVSLYLAALSHHSRGRMIAAFGALAVGVLVHYSAGPYLVVLACHYVLAVWYRRARKLTEISLIVASGTVILATWFGWSFIRFGATDTFASNTTITDAHGQGAVGRFHKSTVDVWRTLVPHPIWTSLPDDTNRLYAPAGFRDNAFLLYQTNALFGLGATGWLVVIVLVWGCIRTRDGPLKGEGRFWMVFTTAVFVLGIAVNSTDTGYGSAHVCLQPLLLAALALISARFFELSTAMRVLVAVGSAIDLAVGIVLHFLLLHTNILPGLGTITTFNWQIKQRVGLVFLGDLLAPISTVILVLTGVGGLAWLVVLVYHVWAGARFSSAGRA